VKVIFLMMIIIFKVWGKHVGKNSITSYLMIPYWKPNCSYKCFRCIFRDYFLRIV